MRRPKDQFHFIRKRIHHTAGANIFIDFFLDILVRVQVSVWHTRICIPTLIQNIFHNLSKKNKSRLISLIFAKYKLDINTRELFKVYIPIHASRIWIHNGFTPPNIFMIV